MVSKVVNLKSKAKILRQYIRLTGLKTPMFQSAIGKIRDVHQLMLTNIDNLNEWQPVTYEGQDAIDISARYFTPRWSVPNEQGQTFGAGVDPNGVLAAIRGQDMIHGRDNKVEYLKEYRNDKGEIK